MFPQEGSLYVWTQKALGPFWGFFAGFCAWWPGVLVMVATGDAVVTLLQFIFDRRPAQGVGAGPRHPRRPVVLGRHGDCCGCA